MESPKAFLDLQAKGNVQKHNRKPGQLKWLTSVMNFVYEIASPEYGIGLSNSLADVMI